MPPNVIELINFVVPIVAAGIGIAWRVDNRMDKIERQNDRLISAVEKVQDGIKAQIDLINYRLAILEKTADERHETLSRAIGDLQAYLRKNGHFQIRASSDLESGH
jgi:hypothetical protein